MGYRRELYAESVRTNMCTHFLICTRAWKTSIEMMRLKISIVEIILTHTHRHTRVGPHYGPAPQELALL